MAGHSGAAGRWLSGRGRGSRRRPRWLLRTALLPGRLRVSLGTLRRRPFWPLVPAALLAGYLRASLELPRRKPFWPLLPLAPLAGQPRASLEAPRRRRSWPLLAAALLAAACAPGIPPIDGGPGAPASPGSVWPAPPAAQTPPPAPGPRPAPAVTAALRADSAGVAGAATLSLADVVTLALANHPATRQSWATARATADVYGATRGSLYPTISGSVVASQTGFAGGRLFGAAGTGIAGPGITPSFRTGVRGAAADTTGGGGQADTTAADTSHAIPSVGFPNTIRQLTPAVTLSYLVFDLGGRASSIAAARERAIAANLAHNATVADVVLQAEASLFTYLANRALRDAQARAVVEAEADLAAARERYRVGVAALQDVLQTETALSQARFQFETLEGAVMSSRGTLAVAMGLPANARFEVPEVAGSESVADVALSVDALVNRAIATRPEVAQVRAQAMALAAEVRVARSALYPALTLTSSASRVHSNISAPVNTYNITLSLQLPIFSGFTRRYDLRAAREQYEAALAQVASQEQQVGLQVFTSYYTLRSATQRVGTAAELLTSARRSADVAAGRYRAGVGTIVDVILTRSALVTARAEAIQARWEWRMSLAQLAHDTGALDVAGQPRLPLVPDSPGSRR